MYNNNYLAETHEVLNQAPILTDYNIYQQDRALVEAVEREGSGRAEGALSAFGAKAGSSEWIEWGFQANDNKPVFYSHDHRGYRKDDVHFHPAYHQLMQASIEHGIHSSHWTNPKIGAHVDRAARFYMMHQVDAGHLCPISMTSAVIPALRQQPDVAELWAPKILAREYDPRNVPDTGKAGLTIGMAMTEKQGGSDVRANTTRAIPIGTGGPGQPYEMVGHKYFVSAPMSDAFLVLAQAPGGLSCFLLPRWRPDGSKNPMQIQRLKNKMGNISNASSETELRGAWALMVGEEGRGVATIIEMVAMTRFDCMVGSAALMRQAVAQATFHAAHRKAFGKRLVDQPLMQNVLADMVIEHEAALAMTMRIGRALDSQSSSESEKQLVRLGTAVGKYWICKRTPGLAYEAMECIGGMGLMEESMMPRLLRESPVNSIWEGSGNVQCLDVLRAIGRDLRVVEVFMAEIQLAAGGNPYLDRFVAQLQTELGDLDVIEYRSRSLVEKMALAFQGSLLVRQGNSAVAEAFCASRLNPEISGLVYGNLPTGVDVEAIICRATPQI